MTKKSENEVEESAYYHKEEPIIKKWKISWKKPIVFEAFCWCWWTSLWFEMAWYEIWLWIDILKPAIDTFKKNHPNSYSILWDIRKVNSLDIKKITWVKNIDVLIWWVPCQWFSLNNKKRNELDKRNFLYLEFVKLIKQLSPKIVVLENVSWMKSTANWKFVDDISKSIESIWNYKVVHKMLYAPDYWVPQKRNRLIFIWVDKELWEEFNFDDIIKTHWPWTDKEYVNIKNAIWDLPELEPGTEKMKYNKEAFSDYQKTMRNNWNILLNHKAPNHPQDTIDKIKNTIPWEPIYEKYKQRIRLSWDILSPTQVSWWIRPQFQFWHPSDNRWLTIRERCRLQSFPDNFEVMWWIVQWRVQTGNAVPPLLAKAVAKALFKYFK